MSSLAMSLTRSQNATQRLFGSSYVLLQFTSTQSVVLKGPSSWSDFPPNHSTRCEEPGPLVPILETRIIENFGNRHRLDIGLESPVLASRRDTRKCLLIHPSASPPSRPLHRSQNATKPRATFFPPSVSADHPSPLCACHLPGFSLTNTRNNLFWAGSAVAADGIPSVLQDYETKKDGTGFFPGTHKEARSAYLRFPETSFLFLVWLVLAWMESCVKRGHFRSNPSLLICTAGRFAYSPEPQEDGERHVRRR